MKGHECKCVYLNIVSSLLCYPRAADGGMYPTRNEYLGYD